MWDAFINTHEALIKYLNSEIVGLYPEGSPSRNSRRPKTSLDPGGGLEIVFNQQ
ncbi:hypothetical protein Bca4012_050322 [Brassica carinata]